MAGSLVLDNVTWQLCLIILIVTGGIGTLPIYDCYRWLRHAIQRRSGPAPPYRLQVHTRLVLASTAALIAGGTAVILLTEFIHWHGPHNAGRFLTALFHSVTARTAGFNTVPLSAIGPLTITTLMILMFIGGSPGGTAGGVRTTVVVTALATLWCQLRQSKRGIVAFNRTIPASTGSQALGLILLALLWLAANLVALLISQQGNNISTTRLLFELISAFATVGLSLDVTPILSPTGKSIIILNMFVGRVGLLTLLATLIAPDPRPKSGKPTENILIL